MTPANRIPRDLRKQAELARRLAQGTTDRVFARKLLDLAEEFEAEAEEASKGGQIPRIEERTL